MSCMSNLKKKTDKEQNKSEKNLKDDNKDKSMAEKCEAE